MIERTESRNTFRALLEIYDQVKTFVEHECDCKVTSIHPSSSASYRPPMGFDNKAATPEEIKKAEFVLEDLTLSFRVEAIGINPRFELEIKVHLVAPSDQGSQFVIEWPMALIR